MPSHWAHRPAGRATRTDATTQGQAQGVGEQRGLGLHGHRGIRRQIETRRLNRQLFECRVEDDAVVLAAGERAQC